MSPTSSLSRGRPASVSHDDDEVEVSQADEEEVCKKSRLKLLHAHVKGIFPFCDLVLCSIETPMY